MRTKTRKTSDRYGHIMVERGIFERVMEHVKDKGYTMNRFASRALEALLEKESRKAIETK